MKNTIIRELLKRLANAPKIVARQYLHSLTNVEDVNDCIRLLKALNIDVEDENFTNIKTINNMKKQEDKANENDI